MPTWGIVIDSILLYFSLVVVTVRTVLSLYYRKNGKLQKATAYAFGDRTKAWWTGAVWPISAVAYGGYLVVVKVIHPLTTPSAMRRDQKAAKKREQAAEIEKAAKELKLPMPGAEEESKKEELPKAVGAFAPGGPIKVKRTPKYSTGYVDRTALVDEDDNYFYVKY